MRKVYYNVEGTIFTSYNEAVKFKNMTSDLENRSVDMETFLEDVKTTKYTKQHEAHRNKVEEFLKFA